MLTKIDIESFGSFHNYRWDHSIGQEKLFNKINIIYGRNYSGKTTLSRIVNCLVDQQLHNDFLHAKFKIHTQTTIVTPANLTTATGLGKFYVYNRDFVSTNLSWLHHEGGEIKPFTILGRPNVALEQQIDKLVELLGSNTITKSIKGISHHRELFLSSQTAQLNANRSTLDSELRNRAVQIKANIDLFIPVIGKKTTYDITAIKGEISQIIASGALTLSQTESDDLRNLLREQAKVDILKLKEGAPQFSVRLLATIALLKKKITLNNPIEELVGDHLLAKWVEDGIALHEHKRTRCAFCDNLIDSKTLWDKLKAHFNEESLKLKKDIESEITNCSTALQTIDDFLLPESSLFYVDLKNNVDLLHDRWKSEKTKYKENLNKLINSLERKLETIHENNDHSEALISSILDNSGNISSIIKELNPVIEKHNQKTLTLTKDQMNARDKLRHADLNEFITAINYVQRTNDLSDAEILIQKYQVKLTKIQLKESETSEKILELERSRQDETEAARLVNEYLKHFFGHQELELVPDGVTPNVKFKITRDSTTAKNLSEGECSLISFCYFMSKLKDNLDINTTVFIDDPISSLDNNHVFFIFSMIEALITKKSFKQLFISTHNLDFFKYLKRLNPTNVERLYFLIERNSKNSTLKPMPAYLSKYVTELQYLFHQIYLCAEKDFVSDPEDIGYIYNAGNNMRKFLEAFLFFERPHHKDINVRLDDFFGMDTISRALVNRYINELSHLAEIPDRAMVPIDHSELKTIAQKIMLKIKDNDVDRFNSFCTSVGVNQNLSYEPIALASS